MEKNLELKKESVEDVFYDTVEDEEYLNSQKEKAEQKGDQKTIEKIKKYLEQNRELMDKLDIEMKKLEAQAKSDEKMRELGQEVFDIVNKKQNNPIGEPEYMEEQRGFTKYNPFTGLDEHFDSREELEKFNEDLKERQQA